MLNISPVRINDRIDAQQFQSLSNFEEKKMKIYQRYLFFSLLAIVLIVLMLPWTQNIRARGFVTSLYPEQRPQGIPTLISGRIEKWYVQEGEFVEKGDTIIHISEVRNEYFDPQLLDRTKDQIQSKEYALQGYREKVKALEAQISAMNKNLVLKLEQARNTIVQRSLKVRADSIDLHAAGINLDIAKAQLERMEQLYEQGLKSKTELEARRSNLQETTARVISLESQLLSSRNEVLNANIEINSIRADYASRLSSTESERYSSLSAMYEAEAKLSELQNQLSNFTIRAGLYFITAPQSGYITQAKRSGIGETLKEGEEIVSIMPAKYQLAVEMYVRPLDLPLIETGQDIRILFDGWPALVFSGWPGVSTGTFGGEVVAIDNFANQQGLYRVLVAPDPQEVDWPEALRVGAGALTFALLKEVPLWYEVWRQVNGFPPDYYRTKPTDMNAYKMPQEKS